MIGSLSLPRRTAPRLVVCGLMLVALALTGLWHLGNQAITRVNAATEISRCVNTEPTTMPEVDDAPFRLAIPMTEGFECVLRITVTNHSGHAVTLGTATFPVGGPGAGASFQTTQLDGVTLEGASTDVHAVTDVRLPVDPGGVQRLDLRVVFRPSGCDSIGTYTSISPTIEVRDLLASRDLVTDFPGFLGTADSSCDT